MSTSGYGRRERGIKAGYDDHVAKPVNPDVLLRAIVRVPTQAPV